MTGFLSAGFTSSELIPVSLDLVAANKSPIKIAGAIILRLQGHSPDSEPLSCATMVYASEAARGFYLSREAMMDLGIVSPNFPSVGAAADPAVTQPPPTISTERHDSLNAGGLAQTTDSIDSCSCPPRTVVPVRPVALSFECTPANNSKMEEWLLHRFASSTFNTCPHRPLPCMTGPPVEIHLEDGVIPRAVHTAAPVPIHWQEQVLFDLKRIFRLKQHTLPWSFDSFDIAHLPGKTSPPADATSRHPSPANEFAELRSLSLHSEMDDAESAMAASLRHETHDIIAISMGTHSHRNRIRAHHASTHGAKTINVFRACIGAQLTICAQK